ncbi:ADP-ribosylglycohydrolase family protein [Verrucomicrobiales bacterium]|nr:ADP-ribosylglycohydrolase family protein [Verrucomicrobiales bacterium]
MNSPFPNSYWLEPGRILCGEYPRDFDDLEDHEGMGAILGAGARVFIDLTEGGELKPYAPIALANALGLGIDPGDLEFHRHPIRDVSVPRNRGEMRAILRAIRLARQQGKTVYLHCWGGRGRTGTVAGCALRDLFGLDGNEALELLFERWRACAKSEWSDSPETEEQTGFVRSFNPVRSRKNQIRGALLGATVGDALGVPVEFAGRPAREKDPVTDMREFGTHNQPAGTWSDDTSMILATMAGLVSADTWSPEAVMEEFSLWLKTAKHTPHGTVFDIGNATREAIHRFQDGTGPLQCGGTSDWSNGNGSLMRILPVALAYADDADLVEKASQMSALTHAHERSRMSCAFHCLVVSELLHGELLSNATAFAWEVMDHRWDFSSNERSTFDRWHPDRLFAREETEIGSSGHVIDTLEAALWVNARHNNYADAVLHAVNLGDDTDTTGCVAGGLAGLIHGQRKIPTEWQETLVKRAELVNIAKSFAEFCVQESRELSAPLSVT